MDLAREGSVEDVRSWPPGEYPKVFAQVVLRPGGAVGVYAEARQWTGSQINVRWFDDEKDSLTSWLPREMVRPVTESEWDIDQFNRCAEWLRGIRWGKRLPGFLPE
ncbi:hypothetical protein PJL18_00098 [Paenarthrobacter nicotinovorans]|nr:hypothetical protein [Paenarthrobacter nicotinovorans]